MAAKPTYAELEQELKACRRETEKYRELIENLNEVLYMADLEARVTYISSNIERLSGYRPEEIIGRRFTDFVHPDDLEDRMPSFLKVLSGADVTTEYRYLIKNGKALWVMTNANPIFKNNEVVGVQGMLVDITERKKMEEDLRESREKYRNILENIEEGYYEMDPEGNLVFFNDALCRIFGYSKSELSGRNIRELVDKANAKKMYKTADLLQKTGKPYKALDWELLRKNGSACSIEASVSTAGGTGLQPLRFRGIIRDTTERRKAEKEKEELRAQLRRAQQMEAIGTLAGGIAHDFNNILSSVIGYAELCLAETGKGNLLHENISRILASGNRAKDLVRQILTLARDENEDATPIQIVPLVKEVMKMLHSTLPATIELFENYGFEDEPLIVEANPTHLHQVILNLATNAKHAIGNNKGALAVAVEPVYFEKTVRKNGRRFRPGYYVKIAVRDTGDGITPENLEKIFDPYFTTRDREVGTGLGLSIVRGIVKNHKGYITVDSKPGKGSTFCVYLPMAKDGWFNPEERADVAIRTGNESILLVDDEQFVTDMEKQYLEKLGYTVTIRTSSIEALEAFRFHPQRFDLVITDMTMPNMTGDSLASEIKSIRPDIPVILCTGFSEHIENNGDDLDVDAFLMKPVARKKMARTVRSVLDEIRWWQD